jgi:carboxyl-terminal processing protease
LSTGRGARLRIPGLLLGFTVALALAVAGCVTRPPVEVPLASLPAAQRARAAENVRVFNRVWDLVNRKHYDPKFQGPAWAELGVKHAGVAAAATDTAALYRVLNTMLEPLQDSHTQAQSPDQAFDHRTRTRARTGFNLVRMDDVWVVSEVLPGSPAEAAGVQVGWIVVSRDGRPVGAQLDFRPQPGDAVGWEFRDLNERVVRVAPVAKVLSTGPRQIARVLEGGWVYLRFDEFDAPDRRWLARELADHATAPGLIIDLRRNPGGETFSLGITVGEFFDHRVDCGTFIRRDGGRSVKNSWQLGSARYRGKVAVLVDRNTGSAAEIFAAVMQDHGRATVIGRRTAGAVLASVFYPLPDGGRLQLSREDYVAPKGRRIEGNGVEPDITVTRTLADLRAGRDPELDAALRVLKERK